MLTTYQGVNAIIIAATWRRFSKEIASKTTDEISFMKYCHKVHEMNIMLLGNVASMSTHAMPPKA